MVYDYKRWIHQKLVEANVGEYERPSWCKTDFKTASSIRFGSPFVIVQLKFQTDPLSPASLSAISSSSLVAKAL
jgi:hypothetical protein